MKYILSILLLFWQVFAQAEEMQTVEIICRVDDGNQKKISGTISILYHPMGGKLYTGEFITDENLAFSGAQVIGYDEPKRFTANNDSYEFDLQIDGNLLDQNEWPSFFR